MARRTARRAEAMSRWRLADIDLQDGVGMLVTPAPIAFLILAFELGKGHVFAVVFFDPHPICLVFVAVPRMVIIVAFVMVFAVLRMENGRESHWNGQRRTQQNCCQKGFHHGYKSEQVFGHRWRESLLYGTDVAFLMSPR